jgi:hypothetical protein
MALGDEIRAGIIDDFRDQLVQMDAKLDRLLVIEERIEQSRETMGRAFGRIDKLEERIRNIELAAPVTKERTDRSTAGWDKMITAVLTAVGTATIALIVFFLTHSKGP